MNSLVRNIFLFSLLLIALFSVLTCGHPSIQEKKIDTAFENQTYKNMTADVHYVGMMKCRQCHYDKYETFIETGMGKSFGRATKTKSSAKFDSHFLVHDKFSDFYYYPFWSGDTMKIMEFRLQGKDTTYQRIEKVDYIIGSGHHTNSHILNTNGYLYQMPMTFYTQKDEWDMPPGFENGYNSRFSRKIGLECMSCHNALPEFVEGSENKFNAVPNGISCERCHGPGEIHVKEKTAGIRVDTAREIDYSIVNPAKLPINLQFDVCQRCHLQGNAVLKEGKSFSDFRPGMQLSDIMSVFLPKYENGEDDFIMASHADRLKQSQCFIQSEKAALKENILEPYKNGLTCITCHNPHISVKVTGKEVFNNACKRCHTQESPSTSPIAVSIKLCSENVKKRLARQDNCVNCHMPKSGSIDIPHVTITDHFIRKPEKKQDIAGIKKFIGLFSINEKNPDSKIKAQAYINQFEKFDRNPALLDSAEKYLPDKTPAELRNNLQYLIHLYFLKNNYEKIVFYTSKFSPSMLLYTLFNHKSLLNEDSWTCYRIAEAYNYLEKNNDAYLFYKNASELSPYNMDFLNKLGGSLFKLKKIEEAQKVYETIIAQNPNYAPAYCNIGFIYFTKGDLIAADNYYNRSLALDPDYEIALMNKVQLYARQGNIKKAKDILSALLKKNPGNEKARILLKQLNTFS